MLCPRQVAVLQILNIIIDLIVATLVVINEHASSIIILDTIFHMFSLGILPVWVKVVSLLVILTLRCRYLIVEIGEIGTHILNFLCTVDKCVF